MKILFFGDIVGKIGRTAIRQVIADLKKEVEDKSQALKDILETGTKEDLEAKSKDLMESLQKVGAEMYKQTPPPAEEKPDAKKPEEGEVVN